MSTADSIPDDPLPEDETSSVATTEEKPRQGIGLGATVVLVVLILCVTTIAIWWRFFNSTDKTVDKGIESIKQAATIGVQAAVTIAREFQPEYINETFIEWSQPTVQGNEGNILEIATATSTEAFASQTYYTAFGKEVPGSKVVSKITVPATYRYHINLNKDWHLVPRDQRIYIVAPDIRPTLPIAFDSGSMKKEVEGSWMRIDEQDDLDALQATLTTELALRAADPKTIEQISDEARLSVAKFAKAWLLSRDHWRSDRFNEIIILFDKEVEDPQNYDYESRLPTLRWSDEAPPTPPADQTGAPESEEVPLIEPAVLP